MSPDRPRPRRRAPPPPTAGAALVQRFSALASPRGLRASEHTFLLVLAGLVGLYGGLAAALFATFISLARTGFFRTNEARAFLTGDAALRARFLDALAHRGWMPGVALLALLAIGAAYMVADRRRRHDPSDLWARRLRALSTLAIVGLGLFYSELFLDAVDRTFLRIEGGLYELVADAPAWVILLVPTLGGAAVGFLVERFSPESRGHGVSEVLEALAIHHARIPPKTALFKGITSALTIASGGSVGREGPVVQIGASVGSGIGQHLGVTRSQLRLLAGCGAAAGISASFGTPIAGAMFALEILLADFGILTFSPIVLAAVVGTVTVRALAQSGMPRGLIRPDLATPAGEIVQTTFRFVSAWEIGTALVLGAICGVVALVFIASMDRVEAAFESPRFQRIPVWLRPALGGLCVGAIGLFAPRVMGVGFETVNAILAERLGLAIVAGVLVAKLVATSLTLGSGGSGGSFSPIIVMGALAGSTFGHLVHGWLPTLTASSGAYALLGMGALVAGAAQAPLTGMIMIFELTSDYQLILPLMVACLSASQLVHRWLGNSIYTLKLAQRGIDPRSAAESEADFLRNVAVREAMRPAAEPVPTSLGFRDLLRRLSEGTSRTYPVLDADGGYLGLLTLEDVRHFLFEEGLRDIVVAGDLARTDVAPLAEDDDLQEALDRMVVAELDELPVVAAKDPGRVVGLIARRDILAARKQAQARAAEPVTQPPL